MNNGDELVKFEEIQNRIFTIRGVQVMLDKDLALFYEVKPVRLREQVKRNIKRFPDDFMFQLTPEEVELMVSQNAIPSKQHLGGYLPYVFTEQGVATISSVLTSARAIEVNIQIMRAFVAMRRFIGTNARIFQRLDTLEIKQIDTDRKIDEVLNAIESKELHPKQGIFFGGQVFDAYSFVADLIRSAGKSIVAGRADSPLATVGKINKRSPEFEKKRIFFLPRALFVPGGVVRWDEKKDKKQVYEIL